MSTRWCSLPGSTRQIQRKYSEAEAVYKQALDISTEQNDWQYPNLILYSLGELYRKQKKAPEREQVIRRRLEILTEYFNRLADPKALPRPKSPITLVSEYISAVDAAAFVYTAINKNNTLAEAAYQQAFEGSAYIMGNIYNQKVLKSYATTPRQLREAPQTNERAGQGDKSRVGGERSGEEAESVRADTQAGKRPADTDAVRRVRDGVTYSAVTDIMPFAHDISSAMLTSRAGLRCFSSGYKSSPVAQGGQKFSLLSHELNQSVFIGTSLRRLNFFFHIFDVSLGFVFRIDLLVVLKNPGLLCFVLSIQLTAFQFRFQQDLRKPMMFPESGRGSSWHFQNCLPLYPLPLLPNDRVLQSTLSQNSSMSGCGRRGNQVLDSLHVVQDS
jgi:hypothetical protein